MGPNVASESSDTESAAERGSNISKKSLFKLTFKKSQGKPDPQEAPMTNEQAEQEPKRDDEGVVYAELDLKNSAPDLGPIEQRPSGMSNFVTGGETGGGARTRLVRPDEDKTEYAEILHAGKTKD